MIKLSFDTSFKTCSDLASGCIVSIGVFDGLHLGHQAIIKKNVELARKGGFLSVVMTFSVNPKMAKGSMEKMAPMLGVKEMDEMLEKMGVDVHCVIDFSSDMSKLSGEEFIAKLCTSCRVEAMVVGTSFRCGNPHESVGSSEIEVLLSRYTSSAFLVVVPSVFVEGTEVSSSLIRRCLLTGDLEQVSKLLGRAYSLDLRDLPWESPCKWSQDRLLIDVRTLGRLLPPEGVYMVEATDNQSGVTQKVETRLCISEDHLALELPVRMKPSGIIFLGA